MKTMRILKQTALILTGLAMAFQINANTGVNTVNEKKAVSMSVDQSVLQLVAKTYGSRIDANDIQRMQKTLGQIDRVTISFTDKDASDYVLNFKADDEGGLEAWMFDEEYLNAAPQIKMNTPVLSDKGSAAPSVRNIKAKNTVNLTLDKPIIEFLASAYGDQVDASAIIRMQKTAGKIDHVTVTFRDADAVGYVLKFKELDEKGLDEWMFESGYLDNDSQSAAEPLVPWMQDMRVG